MASVAYREVQRGTAIAWAFAACALAILVITFRPPAEMAWSMMAVALVLGVVAPCYSSMTVEITDHDLRWTMGRWRTHVVPRSKIEEIQIVRHPVWCGYGIRWVGPNRWAYIASSRDAVDVRLKNGGLRRIGTNDPQGLMAALGG